MAGNAYFAKSTRENAHIVDVQIVDIQIKVLLVQLEKINRETQDILANKKELELIEKNLANLKGGIIPSKLSSDLAKLKEIVDALTRAFSMLMAEKDNETQGILANKKELELIEKNLANLKGGIIPSKLSSDLAKLKKIVDALTRAFSVLMAEKYKEKQDTLANKKTLELIKKHLDMLKRDIIPPKLHQKKSVLVRFKNILTIIWNVFTLNSKKDKASETDFVGRSPDPISKNTVYPGESQQSQFGALHAADDGKNLPQSSSPLYVFSFDFDGCIEPSKKSHDHFLLEIKEKAKASNSDIVLFSGSNRQSKRVDDINLENRKTVSSFIFIDKIASFLSARLDTFLLSDIYGNLKDGKSYERAVDKNYKGEHAEWVFDETKATIIYSQIHKIATENPNTEIVYSFYDDRIDILNSLAEFYKKNRDFIPHNVTLRLYQYAKQQHTPLLQHTIKGIGGIDLNYRQTVMSWATQLIEKEMPDKCPNPANTEEYYRYLKKFCEYHVTRPNLKINIAKQVRPNKIGRARSTLSTTHATSVSSRPTPFRPSS